MIHGHDAAARCAAQHRAAVVGDDGEWELPLPQDVNIGGVESNQNIIETKNEYIFEKHDICPSFLPIEYFINVFINNQG